MPHGGGWREGHSEVQKLTHINNHCLNFYFANRSTAFPHHHRSPNLVLHVEEHSTLLICAPGGGEPRFGGLIFLFFAILVASNFLRNCNPVRHVAVAFWREDFFFSFIGSFAKSSSTSSWVEWLVESNVAVRPSV